MASTELIRLEATSRNVSGKQAAKRLRKEGYTLGVIYGLGKDPRLISIAARHLKKTLQTEHGKHLIEVVVDGAKEGEPVMILEIQREPVSREVLHIDLKRLDLAKVGEFEVLIRFVGKSAGMKVGGRLNTVAEMIRIECLPMNLPDVIEVDISVLEIGDALYVRDLTMPEGVTLLTEQNAMLANIAAPEAEEVEKPKEEEVVEEGAEEEKAEEEEEEET